MIELNTPVVVQQETKTYNEIWLSGLTVMAKDPNKPVRIQATLEPCRTLQNGQKEICPNATIHCVVDDWFGMATETDLQLMGALLTAIKTRANV